MSNAYLQVTNLYKYFQTAKGSLHAVDGVSFTLEKGKTIGVVGESGCGKSTMGRVISRLLDATDGEVLLDGRDILTLKGSALKVLRQDIQMIFQDPYSSLDPRKTLYNTIAEPLKTQRICTSNKELEDRVLRIMEVVGLAEYVVNSYPHELDGGRRQRIGIARALALNPKLIICDEPVSALDVSVQAQILNLLKRLQRKFGYSYIFITHDLSVVKFFAHDVLVMYLGQMVEKAPVKEIFSNSRHPYTQALLSAIPSTDIFNSRERIFLKGEITSPINPSDECRFVSRCAYAREKCHQECPPIVDLGGGHFIRCFYPLADKSVDSGDTV